MIYDDILEFLDSTNQKTFNEIIKMNKVRKTLNRVPTTVLTWGDPFKNCENVIICITGNPGISEFYIAFASKLHNILSMPVCVIGHAGSEEILDKNNKCLFNLMDQLEHKIDFIKNHINTNSKMHIIGHSIGAWMVLELLQKESQLIDRVSTINLLFPTIQHMAKSRNGKFVNNVLRRIQYLVLFLCKILFLLPNYFLYSIIDMYLWAKSLSPELNSSIIKIFNPYILENIFFLAFSEMDTVNSLNTDSIEQIKHLTNVIYANNDGWAPIKYIEDLHQFKPHLKLTEAHNIEHSFVLKSSEKVASLVADFIYTKLK